MDKKYTYSKLFELDAVEVYKLVLEGKTIKRFPKGFWEQPQAIDNAKKCIKYMIEDILKYNDEELKENLSRKLFKDNKLAGMLQYCFNTSPTKAIIETYPKKDFKVWEFRQVPNGYWNKETGIECVKWLIEEKLRLTDEQLKSLLSEKLFDDNGLRGMLGACFNGSPTKAIIESYPEKNYKPWEFNYVPINYWTKETGKQATKWLIETKLRLSDEQLKECLNKYLFIDNGLYGMLQICFDSSPFKAIDFAYPNKFKIEDFKNSYYYK